MLSLVINEICEIRDCLKTVTDYLEKEFVDEDTLFDSKLVVCELVSNVLKHSKKKAELFVEINDDFIEIICKYNDNFIIQKQKPDEKSQSGRGIFLIEKICGQEVIHDGKSIKINIKKKICN